MATLEINVPTVFKSIVPIESLSDVAIEHAPLMSRVGLAILAEMLQKSMESYNHTVLFVTRRPAILIQQLERWIDFTQYKARRKNGACRFLSTDSAIHIMTPDELKGMDLPFVSVDRLIVLESETLSEPNFRTLESLCTKQTVCVGEFQGKDSWFYQWARNVGTKLHRVTAQAIVESFPDQQERLNELKAAFSEDEQLRFLCLEDIEVKSKKRGSYLAWSIQIMPNYCSLPPSKMHHEMDGIFTRLAAKRKQKVVIEGPRDSAKSTHGAEAFPLYCVCHGLEKYILIISDTTEQACKHLDVIKEELENNAVIAERYPDAYGVGPVWKNNAIETRNGIRIEALGAGKKIRGRRFKNHRPSLIVGDDFEGDEAAYSAKTREHRKEWFLKGVMKAGGPNTNFVALGSRIHQDCLVAHIARSPGWQSYLYRSIIRFPDAMDLWAKWEEILRDITLDNPMLEARAFYEHNAEKMEAGSDLLWKEREDLYSLMLMRATDGHAAFEAEKQNNPIDPSKCEWMPHLFENRWFEKWPENLRVVTGALDPSKGKSDKTGDFQGMVAVGIDEKLRMYVDADITRRPMTEMCDKFATFLADCGASIGVCEAEQFQELLLPEIENSAVQELLPCSIEPIMTQGINKTLRIRRLGPWINRGRVMYRKGSYGVLELIKQLQEFPNGSHDDGPDAFEMAMRRALEAIGASADDLRNPF